jgi:acyl carrier protein
VGNDEILPVLAEIIEEIAGVDAAVVTPEKSFLADLDIDSLSMVETKVEALIPDTDADTVFFPHQRLRTLQPLHQRRPRDHLASAGKRGCGVGVVGQLPQRNPVLVRA